MDKKVPDMARLMDIEARASAATRGPWEASYGYNNSGCPTGFFKIPAHNDVARVEMLVDDALFCAHAREDIPYLLALVKELTGRALDSEGRPAVADGAPVAERVASLMKDIPLERSPREAESLPLAASESARCSHTYCPAWRCPVCGEAADRAKIRTPTT